MKRLPMRKIRDALRLRANGLSMREIAASLGVGQSTLSDYLKRAVRAGLAWPLPEALTDAALEAMLFQPTGGATRRVQVQPDWPMIHRELRREDVTLALVWEEYRAAHRDGYGYSRFCELYRRWEGRLAPTMRQHHVAGERMFVDYAGATLPVVDAATGTVREAQLFVAVLGASNYTFAEATWTQSLPDWIGSHGRALAWFGGVPAQVVSDNLKAGVSKACFYEPAVNRTYADMAAHYDTAVVPARPYKPRDKAKVEVAVQVAQRWITARLRHRRFFSLAELNAAIRELVVALNARVTRHLGASRRQLFEELERAALKPLPAAPYEYAQWQERRSGSTTMSRSTAITTRCPTGSCARRSGRARPRRASRSSTTASASRRICESLRTAATRRCATTCPRATGATPTGPRSGSAARQPRSAPERRRWSRRSCTSEPIPSRVSAPASASCGWPVPTTPPGSRPPANARSRSARAPTPRSTRS